MSNVDSKDSSPDAMAQTIDSGSRPVPDAGADTVLGGDSEADLRPAAILGDVDDELVGATLNERYEVTNKLGQGGMGAVYEAKHTLIGKRVAVKVLLDKHAAKDQIVARLKQEARLASSIGHDNIVDITDFGITDSGRTFVVMEYLEGESLGQTIGRQGRIEETRIVHICAQIASALAAAHEKGIVHRDIKPDNIFLVKKGALDFVKVVDFGISKSMDTESEDVRLTQTGMVLGTPLYMSPEQARGDDDLDHRIDIYALGVILYEAVTGEVPFQGKNYLNILTQVISDDPKDPSELFPNIDRDLESVILKAMAKDRDERYQKMSDIAADLEALSDPNTATTGARITAARWRQRRQRRSTRSYAAWMLAVLGVGSVSILAAVLLMGSDAERKPKPVPPPKVVTPVEKAPLPPPVEINEAPQTVIMKVISTPPGADVYRGDRKICGPTPADDCELALTDGEVELTLVKGDLIGFVTVNPKTEGKAPVEGRLKKVKTGAKGKGKGKGKGKDGTADTTAPATNGGSGETIPSPFSGKTKK